jgi:Ca2+-binding EF-hand superfamily protein
MRKVFSDWDHQHKGAIDYKDIYTMLNENLGIRVNKNECKLLLSTADSDSSKDLNLKEFMDFIFTSNIKFHDNDVIHKAEAISDI